MICRRCGVEIPDNSNRCSNCGLKINMYCPSCHALNSFGEKYCVKCGTELLVSCSVCNSTNIYYATECRKCHSPLIKGTKPENKKSRDIPVVENFSTGNEAYITKDNANQIEITTDINDNGITVVETNQTDYCEPDMGNVFGINEELETTAETTDVADENTLPEIGENNSNIQLEPVQEDIEELAITAFEEYLKEADCEQRATAGSGHVSVPSRAEDPFNASNQEADCEQSEICQMSELLEVNEPEYMRAETEAPFSANAIKTEDAENIIAAENVETTETAETSEKTEKTEKTETSDREEEPKDTENVAENTENCENESIEICCTESDSLEADGEIESETELEELQETDIPELQETQEENATETLEITMGDERPRDIDESEKEVQDSEFPAVQNPDEQNFERLNSAEQTPNKQNLDEQIETLYDPELEQIPEDETTGLQENLQKNLEENGENEEKEENYEKKEKVENCDTESKPHSIGIQEETVNKIADIIKNSLKKHIIAVKGAEGSGKSAVLKQVSELMSNKGYLSIYGSCTPLGQITSFGFFQDAFLRIMGFPPYTKSTEAFVKDFKKSNFAKIFSFLNNYDLGLFLNIFYPSMKDSFDNILENKMKIFSILEKILKSFLLNNNLIILIDNFELLDGASYDFIIHMMKNGFFHNRLKLIVAYNGEKDIKSYFELTSSDEKMFETIELSTLNKQEQLKSIERNLNIKLEEILSEQEIDSIINRAGGNAVRVEQEAAFLFDTGYLQIQDNKLIIDKENKPLNYFAAFEDLIKQRINTLPPNVKNVLFMAAIMGYRFATGILCISVAMPVEQAGDVIQYLINNLYIRQVDNYTCEFKSLTLWKLIYQEAKNDLLYKENSQRLYESLKSLILSSNLQKLISCTEALEDIEELQIWYETASITAKLGDTNLYIIALKQCLKLIDEKHIVDEKITKERIYEEMGKLLYQKSPQEAITYLSNVLDNYIKEKNIYKITDISSYFVKSCYLTGNYFGVLESTDAVLNAVNSSEEDILPLEIELIRTRKLNALLNIGNSEEVINIAEEEILPQIVQALEVNQFSVDYKNIILDALFNTMLTLAKAYAIQGNNKFKDIIANINEAIVKYNYNGTHYRFHADIISAFGQTVTGNINQSNKILNNISFAYKKRIMTPNLLASWNLVNIINRVLMKQYQDLKIDLFELAAFANNINDHFIKNIVKLILGYVLQEEGNTEKAEEIYNEQIIYFVKEKIAIGSLLTWALIVQKNIKEGHQTDKALDTAIKALEIAKSAKINNYMFIIYFQKFIAEIYMYKADFATTKMYLEKSVTIAKQYDLKYQLIELYVAQAKCVQELMKRKNVYTRENLLIVANLYQKAIAIAKELELPNIIEITTREYSSFRTFCQLNYIEI